MEISNKIGIFPPIAPDIYPKLFSIIDEAGEFIRSLKDDRIFLTNRSHSEEESIRIQLGILYFLLTERNQCQFEFQDLVLSSRDNLKVCSSHLISIISEFWTRINDNVQMNIINLLIHFLPYSSAESLFHAVFKRMITGDLNQTNLFIVENVLVMIEQKKEHLKKYFAVICYTYLRLIPTHYQASIGNNIPNNNVARLCRKEINFVVELIKSNFDDCFRYGGRDMMFVLQQVSNIPEFKTIWTEMTQILSSLSNHFTDISDIFAVGTSKSIITTAIPHEMEMWIIWMMRNVHHCATSPYKRYQDLFNKKFFPTDESNNLRPFLIRFIIRVFYPDNEMIGSTLISRWATISWIIVQAGTSTVVANCKLALIFDLLFYEHKFDCIMDIEPAILAIMHNISKYSQVTLTLVDFIVKTINNLLPSHKEKIAAKFRGGLQEAARVNVFRTLTPLFEILKQHPELARQFSELVNDSSNNNNPATATVMAATVAVPSPVASATSSVGIVIPPPPSAAVVAAVVTASVPGTNNGSLLTSAASILQTAALTKIGDSLPLDKNGASIKLSPSNKEKLISDAQQHQPQINKSPVIINNTTPVAASAPKSAMTVTANIPNIPNLNIFDPKKLNNTLSNTDRPAPVHIEDEIDFNEIQRRFMKYSLAFDYNVEHIDVPSTIAQITSGVTVALNNLYNAAQQCPAMGLRSRHKREKKLLKKIPKKIDLSDDNDLSGSDEECLQEIYEKMEQVVIAILSDDDNFEDLGTASKTAAVICEICYPYFEKPLFPSDDPENEEKLKASLSHPVFVLFKNICNMSSTDNKREVLLLLLSEMQMRQPRVGYYLLYYLKVAKVNDPDLSTYRSLCSSLEKPNLKNSLYKDLELLSLGDSKLMVFLLPDLYRAFSVEMVGNAKFAHLIISNIDAAENNQLGVEIQKENLAMFDHNNVVDLLRASLDWGTIEQYFLWELLIAHNLPTKCLYGLIPHLDSKKHPEAMLKFSNVLRQEKISPELAKLLLNREVEKGDHFSSSLLHFWITKNKTKFSDVLHSILSVSLGHNFRDRKKKHSNMFDDNGVDFIRILGHLDFMRQYCEDISFLEDEAIQMDLKMVLNSRSLCDDVKSRFSELLAFVEEDTDDLQIDEGLGVSKSGLGGGAGGGLGGLGGGVSSGRVLRNLDSRHKSYEDAKQKRHQQQQSSSSSEDDSDCEIGSGRKLHYPSRSKKRMMITD